MSARSCLRAALVAALLLSLAGAPAGATVPSTTSFQGVLTDGSGNPVPDGTHSLAFALYNVPSGGSAMWTETQGGVPVSKGTFSVTLGSVNPLTLPFDASYWLGVSVDGGAELAPRLGLAPSPYALSLRTPFSAVTNDTLPTVKLKNASPYGLALDIEDFMFMRGHDADNPPVVQMLNPSGFAQLQLLGSGKVGDQSNVFILNPTNPSTPVAFMGNANVVNSGVGTPFGDMVIWGQAGGTHYAEIDGSNNQTGDPKVWLRGTSTITLDSHASGDASVQLPAGAIGPSEISGMPGVAQSRFGGRIDVTSTASMADIETVTVNVPVAGYVVLMASSQVGVYGTTGGNAVSYQIDETQGGPNDATQSHTVGYDIEPNTGISYETASATRTYFKSPGAYTFRLEALHAGGGTAYFWGPVLTAMFFPVSTGGVQTSVLGPELAAFSRASPIAPASNGTAVAAAGGYAVDLRELELRAVRARAAADRAELEVLRAAKDPHGTYRMEAAAAPAGAR